jgi:hypothetical protein
VREALATLPWVEQGSIEPDRSSRTVKFGINDASKFDVGELSEVLGPRYRRGMEVLQGPEKKTVQQDQPAKAAKN